MSEKYTYSISDDTLNGAVDSNKLTMQIEDSSIVTNLEYINTDLGADELDIFFASELSIDDETTLTSVVAAHDGIAPVVNSMFEAVDNEESSTTSTDFVIKKSMAYSGLKAGKYKILISAEAKNAKSSKRTYVQLLDGETVLADPQVKDDDYHAVSCFKIKEYTQNASGIIYVKYKAHNNSTAYIKDVNIMLQRIGDID